MRGKTQVECACISWAAPNFSGIGEENERGSMKLSCSRVMLLVPLLLAINALAASNVHKGSLTIGDALQVNGTTLPAGDYTVHWEGTGPNVEVKFTQGRKVLATASAQLTDTGTKARVNAAEVKNSSDGTRTL